MKKICCRLLLLFLLGFFAICISEKVEASENFAETEEEKVYTEVESNPLEEFMSREWTGEEILCLILCGLMGIVIVMLIVWAISYSIADKKLEELTLRRQDRIMQMYIALFSDNNKNNKKD